MKLRLLLFGPMAEAAGEDRLELHVQEAAAVGDVLAVLRKTRPELSAWLDTAAVAVNREYASADVRLGDGDEVALIPPVSGG